jgi:hypothetical protein
MYPPGYYPSPYPYGGYVSPRTNGLGIAAMILGILWLYWIGSILALIFGIIALKQIREAPPGAPMGGAGMAKAGMILGWVGVGTLVLIVALAIITASS